ncbi:MAG: hypothetical protein LN575_02485 [Rickettsia endosymbiont of Gnoriste bilineata]|nr:hypothetical protein [Rickettsia endosymbiont of Gnoriste bilineata]
MTFRQNMEIGTQSIQDTKDGVRMDSFGTCCTTLQSVKQLLMDIVFVDGSIVPLHRLE